uniref:RHOMBOID-like protein n=2 Tax=Opuntia streptacantha TaxID=393608 RepID=A0A7C9D4G4_OPUST
MLSELLTNWTIYANKCAALLTLTFVIIINLAVGILPHMDNFAHIGGFITGFLLGFILLIRPQFGWASTKHALPGHTSRPDKSKYKTYQHVLWVTSAVLLIAGITVGLVMVFRGVKGNDYCSWCHYLSCVPTPVWSCTPQGPQQVFCQSVQWEDKLNLTCLSNGRSHVYAQLKNDTQFVQQLCTELCS